MRLRSNLVRNILIGGSAVALSACASRAEGVPVRVEISSGENFVPTLTQTPNATAWALTTPEVYQTAIIGTAIAVETKMPKEISGEIENSQHLVNFEFQTKYVSNGVEDEIQNIWSGGVTIFKPISINNEMN